MIRMLASLATAATVAVSAIALPSQAQARHFHHGFGPGIVGGLAAGAVLGAIAAPRYGYGYGYYGDPYYDRCRARRVWGPYGWHWRRFCY